MAEEYFIAKVYRQHNSLVIVVPQAVCIALGVKRGDHMVFTWRQQEGKFKFSKFIPKGAIDVQSSGSSDRKDTGGRI